MSEESVKFAVGGAVQNKQGTYLKRPADEELFEACQAGEFAYVLACRQIGKSSLMVETAKRLSAAGIRTAWIDLNYIGQNVSANEWYFSLIDALANRLKLEVDVEHWWDTRPGLSAAPSRFLQFFREVVLQKIEEPIVIFVDEIDVTLGLEFTDDFFAAIRTINTNRVEEPVYQRLTFVLLGVATPDELIKGHTRTPFNIGQAINLRDFTTKECTPFRDELENAFPNRGGKYFDQIYEWTNGHPYLTQKLCAAVLQSSEAYRQDVVERLVKTLFLAPEARTEDNIQFVQTRVTRDPYAQAMLRIYRRVLEGKERVIDDEQSSAINRLKLYGLVVNQNDRLQVRNKVYTQAFDTTWADEMLRSTKLGLPDKYTILRRLAQRGFITVYLAQTEGTEDTETVALKVLKVPEEARADWADWIEQLERKAQKVAEARHPNVIGILETGRLDEKTLYIVMEYIPGDSLRSLLKEGPWSRGEAIEIVRQIGAALVHIHAQGVFHLAVNPNDILLDPRQEPPRLVLTDFGLAKYLLEEPQSRLQRDYVLRTPQYIAPEKAEGGRLTPAADVYGLAVTFFEALAGQLPPERQPGEPLSALSSVAADLGPYFDKIICQATATEPSDRFNTVTDFIDAVETANAKAEKVEQGERQMRAATVVDAAQGYIDKRRYDPERALSMIEAALEIYPGYVDALLLRGRVWLRQEEIDKALADYAQAYEQEAKPTSVVGLEYLDVLSQMADRCWQQGAFQEAVSHYETIRQILNNGQADGNETLREVWQMTRSRLVEYHQREAENAYALKAPEIIEIIKIFEREIAALEALQAESEAESLRNKSRSLQKEKYEEIIDQSQAAIDQIKALDEQTRFSSEEIFQHYLTLDQAYQALIKLEPDNKQWPRKRREKLRERVELRAQFAVQALGKPESDYETALRHYEVILDIETEQPGITRKLKLDLNETIKSLQEKVNYRGKYKEIGRLIDNGEYVQALERLEREFIQTGNYQYKDVAKWLWRLVYTTKNEGKLPPEWETASVFETLSQRWIGVEQAQLQQLKAKLEPWTQAKILETVDTENEALGDLEKEVEGVEETINQAVAHGLAEKPEVGKCHADLGGVRAQIQSQRQMLFQTGARETAQKVEVWLQNIEDIEALLQTDNPIEDIPKFLDRIDVEQQAIEENPTFESLQTLVATRAKIGRTIDQMKLRIKRRLVRILIEDIGCRDEELIRTEKETDKLKESLRRTQEEVAKAQADRVKVKYHEINRYVIPISLILALITGGMIASQSEALLGLSPIIIWGALILLVVYFVYYVWVYYFHSSSDE